MTEDVPRTFPDIKSFDEEQQQLLDRCEGSQRRYAHLEATEARAQRLCRCELDVCRPLVPGSNPEIGYCQAQDSSFIVLYSLSRPDLRSLESRA